jgi:hypothetical protein
MTAGTRVGCGININAAGHCTNTCNQGGGTSPYAAKKIVSASHVFAYPGSTSDMKMRYMLNFWNGGAAPNSAPQVFVDGTPTAMAKEAEGTYSTPEVGVAPGVGAGACKEYYFVVDGERYPETGVLLTYGVDSCTANWKNATVPVPPVCAPATTGAAGSTDESSASEALPALFLSLLVSGVALLA